MTTPSGLEERMARLEGAYEQINHRIGSLGEEVRELRAEVRELRDRMDQQIGELRRDIRTQFYWLLGIMLGILIPMWVTIILAVLLR